MEDKRINEIINESINELLISEGFFGNRNVNFIKKSITYLKQVLSKLHKNLSINQMLFTESIIYDVIQEVIRESNKNTKFTKRNLNQQRQRQQTLAQRRIQNRQQRGQQQTRNQGVAQRQQPQQGGAQQSQNGGTTQQQTQQPQNGGTTQQPQNQGGTTQQTQGTTTQQPQNSGAQQTQGQQANPQPQNSGTQQQAQPTQQQMEKQHIIIASRCLNWGKQIINETITLLNEYLKLNGYTNNVKEGRIYEDANGTMVNPRQILNNAWRSGVNGYRKGYRWGQDLMNKWNQRKQINQNKKETNQKLISNYNDYFNFYTATLKHYPSIEYVATNVQFGNELKNDIDIMLSSKVHQIYKKLSEINLGQEKQQQT